MSLVELLLLGILIMQVAIFHSRSSDSGRYAKVFNFLIHRPLKYLERNIIAIYCKVASKN